MPIMSEEKRRKFEQQTDMSFQATEEALNLYSRDRKKQIKEMNSKQHQIDIVQSSTSIDDIMNRPI